MYYRSGTDGRCYVFAQQTLCFQSPGGSTLLCEMTSWPQSGKYDITSINPTPSVDVY